MSTLLKLIKTFLYYVPNENKSVFFELNSKLFYYPHYLKMSERFWLENFSSLYSSDSLLPSSNKSRNENLNATTRLVILVFIILLLCGSKITFWFLLFSLIVILLIFLLRPRERNQIREYS